MRDYLMDIVKHTVPLGAFTKLRVEGSTDQVEISATADGNQMVMKANIDADLPEIRGLFGIPDLGLLNTIINISEYDDAAQIEVKKKTNRSDEEVPYSFHFTSGDGDFENEFRLIGAEVIDKVEPKVTLKVDNWPVDFAPTERSQLRYKAQLTANSDENTVTFGVENGTATTYFGDGSGHSGEFVFEKGLDDEAKLTVTVNSGYLAGIFAMTGDKTMKIGQHGMMINVNSGLVNYDYILPNITK